MSKENHATNKGITLTNICLEYTVEASHVFNFQQSIYYVSKRCTCTSKISIIDTQIDKIYCTEEIYRAVVLIVHILCINSTRFVLPLTFCASFLCGKFVVVLSAVHLVSSNGNGIELAYDKWFKNL